MVCARGGGGGNGTVYGGNVGTGGHRHAVMMLGWLYHTVIMPALVVSGTLCIRTSLLYIAGCLIQSMRFNVVHYDIGTIIGTRAYNF